MAERRAVSAEELARHTSEDDCWVSCHDLVLHLDYQFMQEHPGGPDIVMAVAGKDVTLEFEDILHSNSARDWANKYIVGYMEGAPEEARTKLLPREEKISDGHEGDGGGLLPVVGAVAVGLLAVAAVSLRLCRLFRR